VRARGPPAAPRFPTVAARKYPLGPRQRLIVALRSDADPKTIDKYLATDLPIRPRTLEKIEHALRSLGWLNALREFRGKGAA
jgi:hypothetical protein